MKKFLSLFCILLASLAVIATSCSKQPSSPPGSPTVEGSWKSLVDTNPDWHYVFSGNIMSQFVIESGDTLAFQMAPYSIQSDTLFIDSTSITPARIWKLTFHCDSVLQANNITPAVLLAPVMYLKKQNN